MRVDQKEPGSCLSGNTNAKKQFALSKSIKNILDIDLKITETEEVKHGLEIEQKRKNQNVTLPALNFKI